MHVYIYIYVCIYACMPVDIVMYVYICMYVYPQAFGLEAFALIQALLTGMETMWDRCPDYQGLRIKEKNARPPRQCWNCRKILQGKINQRCLCCECLAEIERYDKCPLCKNKVSIKEKEERTDWDERCSACRYPACISCGELSVTVWTPGTYGKREYRCEDCADKWQCRGTCQRRLPADAFACDASRHRYAVCKECQHPACATCGQRTFIYTYKYVYMHTYIYIHTHIYIYIHTYIYPV